MRFATVFTVALSAAGFAAAQKKCDAQNIVDTCVAGYQSRIEACQKGGNDFICLCDVYRDVLVCYNNCPDSQDRSPVQNQVTSYCTAAEPLRAAASASAASVASVAATQSRAATSSVASATGSGTRVSSSPVASSFSTGAAAAVAAPAGAAIVAFLGAFL